LPDGDNHNLICEAFSRRRQGEAKERSLQILKLDPNSRIYKENAQRVSELEDEETELQKDIAKLEGENQNS